MVVVGGEEGAERRREVVGWGGGGVEGLDGRGEGGGGGGAVLGLRFADDFEGDVDGVVVGGEGGHAEPVEEEVLLVAQQHAQGAGETALGAQAHNGGAHLGVDLAVAAKQGGAVDAGGPRVADGFLAPRVVLAVGGGYVYGRGDGRRRVSGEERLLPNEVAEFTRQLEETGESRAGRGGVGR